MAEVVVSSDDLTVLGGPAIVEVDLNIGPAGDRGVFISYGIGDPRVVGTLFSATPKIFDLYILTDPASADYLQIFQYINLDGNPTWDPAIKLSQNFYATTRVLPFVAGESSITFDAFELGLFQERLATLEFPLSAAYLNVQATPGNFDLVSHLSPELLLPLEHYPTSMSVLVNDLFLDDDETKIKVDLKAAEFDGTDWANVNDKNLVVHFYMQIVDPTFMFNAIAELSNS
jgi:hypothetical protein